MWIIQNGSVRPGCGRGARVSRGRRLGWSRLAHADDAVDLPTLVHQEALARDVAVHHARRLNLHALAGDHRAAHFPADDRFAGDHVALHLTTFRDQHLAACAHRTDHRALDLHDSLSRDIPYHPHPCTDD